MLSRAVARGGEDAAARRRVTPAVGDGSASAGFTCGCGVAATVLCGAPAAGAAEPAGSAVGSSAASAPLSPPARGMYAARNPRMPVAAAAAGLAVPTAMPPPPPAPPVPALAMLPSDSLRPLPRARPSLSGVGVGARSGVDDTRCRAAGTVGSAAAAGLAAAPALLRRRVAADGRMDATSCATSSPPSSPSSVPTPSSSTSPSPPPLRPPRVAAAARARARVADSAACAADRPAGVLAASGGARCAAAPPARLLPPPPRPLPTREAGPLSSRLLLLLLLPGVVPPPPLLPAPDTPIATATAVGPRARCVKAGVPATPPDDRGRVGTYAYVMPSRDDDGGAAPLPSVVAPRRSEVSPYPATSHTSHRSMRAEAPGGRGMGCFHVKRRAIRMAK